MDGSETSLIVKVTEDETEKELKNNLPPWKNASFSQKALILLIKLLIYIPLITVLGLIFGLCTLYAIFFVHPILSEKPSIPQVFFWHNQAEKNNAIFRASIFSSILLTLVINILFSLYKASVTEPGGIPNTAEWEIVIEDFSDSNSEIITTEKRKDGLSRTCKYCLLKKPDRCHHCKQCDRCVLKMDHHCNWIINCVGNNNYKYFFLTIFYSALALGVFIGTFWESVLVYLLDPDVPSYLSLFLVSCYSLTVLLSVAVFFFLGFHFWLIYENYTTIEYCEKKRSRVGKIDSSYYSTSLLNNYKEALGENPWFWFIPFAEYRPINSGFYFRVIK